MAQGEQPPRQKVRRRPSQEALAARGPWLPAEYQLADATAIQALAAGTADKEQQIRALRWIVNQAAGTYEPSYRPGRDGERDTAFAEGKRFVGMQVVKLTKINVAALRRGPQSDEAGEHG